MKIKINAFLNIEFCVEQQHHYQHPKTIAIQYIRKYVCVQCHFQSNFHASIEVRWMYFQWALFNTLFTFIHSVFVVTGAVVAVDEVVKQTGKKRRHGEHELWILIVNCDLHFANDSLHRCTPTHTNFCYLKSILKYGRTTAQLNICQPHRR